VGVSFEARMSGKRAKRPGNEASMNDAVEILKGLAEAQNIADLPNSPYADEVVRQEGEISGFRYQILVGNLAKKVAADIRRQVDMGPLQNDDARMIRRIISEALSPLSHRQLAEIVRWSDALCASESNPDGPGRFNLSGGPSPSQALREFATYLLTDDVITCVQTGGYK
jgi:hypothetical protein